MYKSGIWTTTTTTKKKTKKRKRKENTTHNSKNFIRINIDTFKLHGSIKEAIYIYLKNQVPVVQKQQLGNTRFERDVGLDATKY